jgi:hypothetical protein
MFTNRLANEGLGVSVVAEGGRSHTINSMVSLSRSIVGQFVHLEWDRGHESFDAIVVAQAPAGMIARQVHDYVPIDGYKWIRSDEVVDIEFLDDDHPAVRLARLRGLSVDRPGRGMSDLAALLRAMRRERQLILVQQERTGSDAGLVGYVSSLDPIHATLDDVDPQGRYTGDLVAIRHDQIISVEWRTPYLTALNDLVQAGQSVR